MLNLQVKSGAGNGDRTRDIVLGKHRVQAKSGTYACCKAVLVLVLATGCGTMQDQSWDQHAQQDQHELRFVNFAPGFDVQAKSVMEKLGMKFGVRFDDVIAGESVTVTGQLNAIDCSGTITEGCTRLAGGFQVAIKYHYGVKADETALAHEMTHVYAQIVEGDIDHDHKRRYLWDVK